MLKISSGQDWTFEKLEEVYEIIEKIAVDKYKMDLYPNQIEIISSEQMLEQYTSHGLPVFYGHWSMGQSFIQQSQMYKKGHMGLAFEIVINTNPSISYCMQDNTMGMQALVIAHAACGHNHFFKNNYLFKQWTAADAIIDYLKFAKKYISECEEKYGPKAVEATLDAAHSLQHYGVDKYKRSAPLNAANEELKIKEREEFIRQHHNELWNTIPVTKAKLSDQKPDYMLDHPEENIMYFLEKYAPTLETWQREIIRIVRKIAQYFYPQMQTKIGNEGFASYTHYNIMTDLHEMGVLDDGAMLEFLHSHTSVVAQPGFDSKYYSGFNPYALGFAIFKDIERICKTPTEEDRKWFAGQDWVGNNNHVETINWAVANFKDESFIRQFLSPKVMRDLKMFVLHDDYRDTKYEISAIHNDKGYEDVVEAMVKQTALSYYFPDIQVVGYNKWGDRELILKHTMENERPLDATEATNTLRHLSYLWGEDYPITIESVKPDPKDPQKEKIVTAYEIYKGEVKIHELGTI